MSRPIKPNQTVDANRVIGQKIRQARRSKMFTQDDLGRHLGVEAEEIDAFERGASRVGSSQIVLIARALRVPIKSLYSSPKTANAINEMSTLRQACMEEVLGCDDSDLLSSMLSVLRLFNAAKKSGRRA